MKENIYWMFIMTFLVLQIGICQTCLAYSVKNTMKYFLCFCIKILKRIKKVFEIILFWMSYTLQEIYLLYFCLSDKNRIIEDLFDEWVITTKAK